MSLRKYNAYKRGWEDGANSGRWQDRYAQDSPLEKIYAEGWRDGTAARVEALNKAAKNLKTDIGRYEIG